MYNILDKIANTEVEKYNWISQDDRDFIKSLSEKYEAKRNELYQWLKAIEKIDIKTYANVDIRYNKPSRVHSLVEGLDKFDYLSFSPLYPIHTINALLKSCRWRFEDFIVTYFKETYNLTNLENKKIFDLKDYEIDSDARKVDSNLILDYIGEQNEFKDLSEVGKQNVKDTFLSKMGHGTWGCKIKIQKNKMHISNFLSYKNYSWDNGISSTDDIHALSRIIHLFLIREVGSLNAINKINEITDLDFTETHPIYNNKIKGLKLFKNGKITIIFDDEQSANEFYQFAELEKTLREREDY